jgi:hypothetical protein
MKVAAIKTRKDLRMYCCYKTIQHRVHLISRSEEIYEELYEEAESEEVRFCRAAASYERVADAKYKTHITVQGLVHTWDEVLDEVNHVAYQYKDSSTFWGKIRKGLRKFGDNHRAFDAWLGLLPTQSHYLSSLCGGLKLVIRVRSFAMATVEYDLTIIYRLQHVSQRFVKASAMRLPRFQHF